MLTRWSFIVFLFIEYTCNGSPNGHSPPNEHAANFPSFGLNTPYSETYSDAHDENNGPLYKESDDDVFDILTDVSFARKCGKRWDDRYRRIGINTCPIISEIVTKSMNDCIKECIRSFGECRSWNFEISTSKCTTYSAIVRARRRVGYTSGDLEAPIRVVSNGIVSSSGSYICSCSDISKSMKILNRNEVFFNHTLYYTPLKSIRMRPSCLSQEEHCDIQRLERPSAFHDCRISYRSNRIPKVHLLITIAQPDLETHGAVSGDGSSDSSGGDGGGGDSGSGYFNFLFQTLIRLATVPSSVVQDRNAKIQLQVIIQKKGEVLVYPKYYELLTLFDDTPLTLTTSTSDTADIPSSSSLPPQYIFGEYKSNIVLIPSPISCHSPTKYQVLSLRSFLLNSPSFIQSTMNMMKKNQIFEKRQSQTNSDVVTTTTDFPVLLPLKKTEEKIDTFTNNNKENMMIVLIIDVHSHSHEARSNEYHTKISNMPHLMSTLHQLFSNQTKKFEIIKYSSFVDHHRKQMSQLEILTVFSFVSMIISPYPINYHDALSNMIVSQTCTTIIEGKRRFSTTPMMMVNPQEKKNHGTTNHPNLLFQASKALFIGKKKNQLKSSSGDSSRRSSRNKHVTKYEHIANMLGFSYHSFCVDCATVKSSNGNNNGTLVVDVDEIVKIVEAKIMVRNDQIKNNEDDDDDDESRRRNNKLCNPEKNDESENNQYLKAYNQLLGGILYEEQIAKLNELNRNGFPINKKNHEMMRPKNMKRVKPNPKLDIINETDVLGKHQIVTILVFFGFICSILCGYFYYSLPTDNPYDDDDDDWRSR